MCDVHLFCLICLFDSFLFSLIALASEWHPHSRGAVFRAHNEQMLKRIRSHLCFGCKCSYITSPRDVIVMTSQRCWRVVIVVYGQKWLSLWLLSDIMVCCCFTGLIHRVISDWSRDSEEGEMGRGNTKSDQLTQYHVFKLERETEEPRETHIHTCRKNKSSRNTGDETSNLATRQEHSPLLCVMTVNNFNHIFFWQICSRSLAKHKSILKT